MAEHISRNDALLHSEIIRVYSKDYGNIDVVPVEYLADIPAADVQPIRHGRWIPQGDNMWLCSNCKKNIIYSEHESDRTEKQRYCCRCGARMDGGIDG